MFLLFVVIWHRIILFPPASFITNTGLLFVCDKLLKGKSTIIISNFLKFIVNMRMLFHLLRTTKILLEMPLKAMQSREYSFLFDYLLFPSLGEFFLVFLILNKL